VGSHLIQVAYDDHVWVRGSELAAVGQAGMDKVLPRAPSQGKSPIYYISSLGNPW
jgi:hypothetical protein